MAGGRACRRSPACRAAAGRRDVIARRRGAGDRTGAADVAGERAAARPAASERAARERAARAARRTRRARGAGRARRRPEAHARHEPTAANLDAAIPADQRAALAAQQQAQLAAEPAAFWRAHVGGVYVDGDTVYYVERFDERTQRARLVRTHAATQPGPVSNPPQVNDPAALPEQFPWLDASAYGPGGAYEYVQDAAGRHFRARIHPRTGTVSFEEVPRAYRIDHAITVDAATGARSHATTATGELANGGTDATTITVSFAADGTETGSTVSYRRHELAADGATRMAEEQWGSFDAANAPLETYRYRRTATPHGQHVTVTDHMTFAPGGIPATRTVDTTVDGAGGVHTTLDNGTTVDRVFESSATYGYTAEGLPTSAKLDETVYGTTTVRMSGPSGLENDDAGVTVRRQTTRTIDGAGQALQFDAQGQPTNAATDTVSAATWADYPWDAPGDGDETRDILYVQGGHYENGRLVWDGATEVHGRFDYDPAHRWEFVVTDESTSYTAEQLDEHGQPRQVGNPVVTLLSTGMQVAGTLLLLVPGAQWVGAGLILGGAGLALSQSVPAFLDDPSVNGALQVGLDGLGGMVGVGTAARGVRYLGWAGRAASWAEPVLHMAGLGWKVSDDPAYVSTGNFVLDMLGLGVAARSFDLPPTTTSVTVLDAFHTGADGASASTAPADAAEPPVEPPAADAA